MALFVRSTRLQLRVSLELSGNYGAASLVSLSPIVHLTLFDSLSSIDSLTSFVPLVCSSVFPLTLDKDMFGVKTQTPLFQITSRKRQKRYAMINQNTSS